MPWMARFIFAISARSPQCFLAIDRISDVVFADELRSARVTPLRTAARAIHPPDGSGTSTITLTTLRRVKNCQLLPFRASETLRKIVDLTIRSAQASAG